MLPPLSYGAELWTVSKLVGMLEAAIGVEPMNKGFAEIICGHPPVNTEEQGVQNSTVCAS